MRKTTHIICLLAALCLAAPRGTAQIIVTGDRHVSASLPSGSVVWMHAADGRFFAALETGKIPASCTILDTRGNIGTFYWAEDIPTGGLPAGCRLLWKGSGGSLIKADRMLIPPPGGPGTAWMILDGLSAPPLKPATIKQFARAMPSFSGNISAILDSVHLDRIMQTLADLSGETSFTLDDATYTLMTRYVYSPQIHTARAYLLDQLAGMGYTAYVQQFQIGYGTALDVNPAYEPAGIACSGSGLLLADAQSESWTPVWHDAGKRRLTALSRPGSGIVWAVGMEGLLLTYNLRKGNFRLFDAFPEHDLFDVCFTDGEHGWVCGSHGLIAATQDGGVTWSISSSGTDVDLYTVTITADGNGWAAGQDGTLLHTDDGGNSWRRLPTGSDSWLYDICFTSRDRGWIVGSQATLLHTDDGGNTWLRTNIPVSTSLLDIDFSADGTGCIAGRNGTLLQTRDNGRTWQAASAAVTGDIYSIAAVDGERIVTGGDFGLMSSNNGGAAFRTSLVPGETFYNVIAEKTGSEHPDISYIICAHYDSINDHGDPLVRAPGADDNGSGCAAVLEAARVLAPYDADYTIKFILFSAEEIGLYGSKAYVQAAISANEQIAGVINLDMIGYENDDYGRVEFHTNFAQTALVDSMVAWAGAWNLPLVPKRTLTRANSDHWPFLNAGYQALMVIEDTRDDFNPNYHSADDLPEYINTRYFQANVKLAVGTLARFAGIDLPSTPVSEEDGLQPAGFRMYAPWPNPFNPAVTAAIDLARNDNVSVEVFDLLGRKVRRLHQGRVTAGYHTFVWNGTDQQDRPAASGVYLIVCRTGSGMAEKRKIVLMR